ncbi:hypothetical protein IEQ34_019573 [Dendrobium chrysotoxum]|uniref:Uncharacterized protein n=1 Tax=Dendrobium chrysotoxum TaxID=161865 RepID=A0AAV7G8X8_DENCH|nr:hypothetical protein IEQ34_019573 [Dendrobium chrysotoxum]
MADEHLGHSNQDESSSPIVSGKRSNMLTGSSSRGTMDPHFTDVVDQAAYLCYKTTGITSSKIVNPRTLTYPVLDIFAHTTITFILTLAVPFHSKLLYEFFASLRINSTYTALQSYITKQPIEITYQDCHELLQLSTTGEKLHLIASGRDYNDDGLSSISQSSSSKDILTCHVGLLHYSTMYSPILDAIRSVPTKQMIREGSSRLRESLYFPTDKVLEAKVSSNKLFRCVMHTWDEDHDCLLWHKHDELKKIKEYRASPELRDVGWKYLQQSFNIHDHHLVSIDFLKDYYKILLQSFEHSKDKDKDFLNGEDWQQIQQQFEFSFKCYPTQIQLQTRVRYLLKYM